MKHLHLLFLTPVLLSLVSACSGKGWSQEDHGCYSLISQREGPALGYSPSSGVTLLSFGGKAFKDMNRNGALDPYEDWRLTPEERADDLSRRLSVETQKEDLPRDMVCYKDAAGNRYDFAFGMNWKGVIHDKRTAKYK